MSLGRKPECQRKPRRTHRAEIQTPNLSAVRRQCQQLHHHTQAKRADRNVHFTEMRDAEGTNSVNFRGVLDHLISSYQQHFELLHRCGAS